jgi:hypothetical protein
MLKMKEDKTMKNEAVDFPAAVFQRWTIGSGKLPYLLAFGGICGGISAIFIGFILMIIHSALTGDTILDEIGTVLMIAGIPMLFLGGHFMDKALEKKN